MARAESDREDLFAEATALVRRAELSGPGWGEPIVAGFKRDGGLSVYFGGDPVYHFDSDARLKRAYRSGRLFRTQGDTLAELTRQRSETATILQRRDLPADETAAFLEEMLARLTTFVARLEAGELTAVRRHPQADGLLPTDLAAFVDNLCRSSDRLAPRFRGKR